MNGHLGLIHAIIPATVDIRVSIPEDHPSTKNLGSERTGSGTIVDPEGYRWNIATHKEDLTPEEIRKRQDEWMRQFATAHT